MPGGVSRAIQKRFGNAKPAPRRQRLVAVAWIILRACRPGVNLDAMMTEEKTQFGGVSLDVTHVVET